MSDGKVEVVEKKEYKMKTPKQLTIDAVSGGASGALEILFTYPFEYAKTQKQLYPTKFKKTSTIGCWKLTYNQFGGFPKYNYFFV